jgi:DNA-directed RNA polymerase
MNDIKISKLFKGAIAISVGLEVGKLAVAVIDSVTLAIVKQAAPEFYNDVRTYASSKRNGDLK